MKKFKTPNVKGCDPSVSYLLDFFACVMIEDQKRAEMKKFSSQKGKKKKAKVSLADGPPKNVRISETVDSTSFAEDSYYTPLNNKDKSVDATSEQKLAIFGQIQDLRKQINDKKMAITQMHGLVQATEPQYKEIKANNKEKILSLLLTNNLI